MSISRAYTAHLSGLNLETITVEVDISNGLHSFSVVGLGDRSVEEAKDRISAAIKNSGRVSPKQKNQKVIISLAPADTRKEGPSFDLAMAIAYLAAAGDIELDHEGKLFIGELSLDGSVRKVHGLLPMLVQASKHGFTSAFIPMENAEEARLARDILIYPISSLDEAIRHISHIERIEPLKGYKIEDVERNDAEEGSGTDMSMVRGNESAKRALEIAAAGAHNVILYGPPGTGKTLLAHSFASILPSLSYEQSIEVTSIHSAARTLQKALMIRPPFRSPHHTSSHISILGGGSTPRPGEITLAHRGVLFLDEFPEFDRKAIEGLRQPLEDKVVTVARARGSVTFPAQCILIASMNPCRCGKGKDSGCTCPPHIREAYARKISGPVLDRIDLWVDVAKVDYEKLAAVQGEGEASAAIRGRVEAARKIQEERFRSEGSRKIYFNNEMGPEDIEKKCLMSDKARTMIEKGAARLKLSARGFHRAIKVARTIADLAGSEQIDREHILEALQYRKKSD